MARRDFKDRTKFFFNTGVKIWVNPHIKGGIDSGNGTVVIPFHCDDVPDNAEFMFASDYEDLSKHHSNVIQREIRDSELLSKFAYFKIV